MSHTPSIVGTSLRNRWIANSVLRRSAFVFLLLIALILSVFPRTYIAQIQLNQPSSNAAGLGALLGQLGGNYAALLGGGQPYEVDLAVGRSVYVEKDVIDRMRLLGTPGFGDERQALRTIERVTSVDSLRGAIIKISVRHHDENFALKLASTYADVFRQRLAELGREQTAYKRRVLNDRLTEASKRLSSAQFAVDQFRASNHLPDPQNQLDASVSALSGLQSQLQQQEIELQTTLRSRTPENFVVKSLQARLTATRAAIANANRTGRTGGGESAAGLSALSNKYLDLLRDLRFAQSLYESYTKYLEGAAVEDESANWNMQVLQPVFIEPGIALNRVWFAAAMCLCLIWLCLEFYVYAPQIVEVDPLRATNADA